MRAGNGIRRVDLVKLTWAEIGAGAIETRRANTSELAVIPLFDPIPALLKQAPRISPTVLTNTKGKP